jgi:hypothetical protein
MRTAPQRVRTTPTREWFSEMSKGLRNIPANILPPAIAAVTDDEMPAKSKANAKTKAALIWNSSELYLKKVYGENLIPRLNR